MLTLKENYRQRSIRFLDLWEPDGWQLKVYGIAYTSEYPSLSLVEAAKKVVRSQLPPTDQHNYGVGFLGVHEGRGTNFVFVDWWADENELHHHVYVSSQEQPEQ